MSQMGQISISDFEYAGKRKQTRSERLLAEMDQVVPWTSLLRLIKPFYPKSGGGRIPYPLESMLRIHLLQNWFPCRRSRRARSINCCLVGGQLAFRCQRFKNRF